MQSRDRSLPIECSPLWRRGQPCGWTVSHTLVLVLCLEGGRFVSIFYISQLQLGVFSSRLYSFFIGEVMADRGVDLSALPKEVRDQLAELDLELSEGKGGEGADGLMGRRDAIADFQASYVSQLSGITSIV